MLHFLEHGLEQRRPRADDRSRIGLSGRRGVVFDHTGFQRLEEACLKCLEVPGSDAPVLMNRDQAGCQVPPVHKHV